MELVDWVLLLMLLCFVVGTALLAGPWALIIWGVLLGAIVTVANR